MNWRKWLPWNWGKKHPESKESQLRHSRHSEDLFLSLRRDVHQMFEDLFRGIGLGRISQLPAPGFGLPVIDVSESDDEIEVTAELPGLSEQDVDVSLTGDILRIRGEKKHDRQETRNDYYLTERSWGMFSRDIPLWTRVDSDHIDACFREGVLQVRLPKVEKGSSTRRIPVRTAS